MWLNISIVTINAMFQRLYIYIYIYIDGSPNQKEKDRERYKIKRETESIHLFVWAKYKIVG